MKPGYIFSAVFVVILAMVLGLPQLTAVSPVHAAEPASRSAVIDAAPSTESGTEGQPTLAPQPHVAEREAVIAPIAAQQDSIPLTSVAASELQSFIDAVLNNQAGQVVGVYRPGLFALPILQQPANDHNFISPFDGVITQYAAPLEYGSIGLLAHNHLSGRVFFNLEIGQEITLVYGDGSLIRFRITAIDNYQALSSSDPYSDFIDQADPRGTIQSFQEVYDRYYKVDGQLTFQTCIEKNGDLSWGRIFVVAQRL